MDRHLTIGGKRWLVVVVAILGAAAAFRAESLRANQQTRGMGVRRSETLAAWPTKTKRFALK